MGSKSRVDSDDQKLRAMNNRLRRRKRNVVIFTLLVLPVLGVVAWAMSMMSAAGF